MSESLYDALVETRVRIERGIDDAQGELRDARERCAKLEGVIRSLRTQQWDHAPPLPEIASEAALVVIPDVVDEPPPSSDADDLGESEPLEVPTSYMPMLEELWDIARRADPGT